MGEDVEKLEPSRTAGGNGKGCSLYENRSVVPKKMTRRTTVRFRDSSEHTLRITGIGAQRRIFVPNFIAAFFTIAKGLKHPKDRRMGKPNAARACGGLLLSVTSKRTCRVLRRGGL